jgi:hypothetical protein
MAKPAPVTARSQPRGDFFPAALNFQRDSIRAE